MKRLLLTFFLLAAGLQGFAASNPPQCIFHTYSTIDGLTHDRIADIYTDSRGFVWVCTWYGVSRFDGYTFKNFSTSPADYSPLSHHRFVSVSEDSLGHLWFTTYNLHVYRFNRFTEQFEDVVSLVEGVDSKHYRTSYCLHDGDGGTWVAIVGMGLVRFASADDQTPVRVDVRYENSDLGGEVTALCIDRESNAWVASAGGQVNCIAAEDRQSLLGVTKTSASVFAFDEGREYVYGVSPRALVRVQKQGHQVTQVSAVGSDLTAVVADSVLQRVYAGSRSGELYQLENDRLVRLLPKGTHPGRIRNLACDSHGTVWITTPKTGIMRYDPSKNDYRYFVQEPYTVSYNIDTITKIAEGGGRLWIKMNNYGFGYYDRENDRVEPFYNDPKQPNCQMTNAVVRFDVHDDGVLWLSTYYERGLRKAVILEQPAEIFSLDERNGAADLSGEIRAMMNDSRGRVWVGTRDGELICFGADKKPVSRFSSRQVEGLSMIYSLKEDSKGNIW